MVSDKQNRWPTVTVIAPCRNEVGFIEEAIDSILRNDYPADKMELLIVDGMSHDGTRDVVSKIAQADARVRLIDNPDKIVPTAMNAGIKAATGEFIIRIDCHAKFSTDYIRKCISVYERTNAANVGGYWTTLPGAETKIAYSIAAATSCGFGVGNSRFRLTGDEREVDTVPFGTYKRDIFDKVGLYDTRLVRNQDIELNHRIRKGGGKIVISPEIKLAYYNRSTLRGLWQQSFNNGLWNPYTMWLVGGGLSLRHFVPMFFVLGLIVLTGAGLVWTGVSYLLALYLLVYAVAAAFFSVKTARQEKANPFLIWICFWLLHAAYGLGSIWAVVTIPFKFPHRRKSQPGQALRDRI